MTNANFTPEGVAAVSSACASICKWVTAVANFTDVNKLINSKKAVV